MMHYIPHKHSCFCNVSLKHLCKHGLIASMRCSDQGLLLKKRMESRAVIALLAPFWWLLICIVLLGNSLQAQQIIYVDDSAAGSNDGSSWEDAYAHLQDAIAQANTGTQIWVAQGVYYPDLGRGIALGNREVSFEMKKGVAIYGGFSGQESNLDARDPTGNWTVLSGDLQSNDNENLSVSEPSRAENSYSVVIARNDADSTTLLDGFTITAYSDTSRPVIPIDPVHRFRRISSSDSD